ncbi:hypothetical protein GCM10009790_37850 [Georgenia ruanii]
MAALPCTQMWLVAEHQVIDHRDSSGHLVRPISQFRGRRLSRTECLRMSRSKLVRRFATPGMGLQCAEPHESAPNIDTLTIEYRHVSVTGTAHEEHAVSEAWINDDVRTRRAKGEPAGALHKVRPQQLLAQLLQPKPVSAQLPSDQLSCARGRRA